MTSEIETEALADGDLMDGLRERLRVALTARKVRSKSRIALAANLSESGVRDILELRSRNPGVVTIAKIAAVLEVSPGWLAFGEGEMEPAGTTAAEEREACALIADTMSEAVNSPNLPLTVALFGRCIAENIRARGGEGKIEKESAE